MWAIISTSNSLKFYCFKTKEFNQFVDLNFTQNELGQFTGQIAEDNFAVGRLLSMGIPVFVNKKDARDQVLSERLTGFKYLKLSPTILIHA